MSLLPLLRYMEQRRPWGPERAYSPSFLTVEGVRRRVKDVRCRLTDVVLHGSTCTFSLVNPRSIYIVALIVTEVFLGISGSEQRVRMEGTLPNKVPEVQESKIAVSAEPLGRPFTSKLWRVCKRRSILRRRGR